MAEPTITIEQVEENFPKIISLTYVDYRESFDDNEDVIQKAISEGEDYHIYDKIDEWYDDQKHETIRGIKKEIRKRIQSEYNLKKHEAKSVIEYYDDEINNLIYEKDDSTTMQDLLRNTGTIVAHYDTGYEMESDSWQWSKEKIESEVNTIKALLHISESTKYDDALFQMIAQATYGGSLLIYFEMDVNKFLSVKEEQKTIVFNNSMIGVIDHNNGSGDVLEIPIEETLKLPYNHKNVFLEKSIKYNWTYSIAGMSTDWARSTKVEFTEEVIGEAEDSKTNELLSKEEQYNKTFSEGSCTFGDMDIKRHRDVRYSNNYPCGNRCPKCQTFWID